MAKSKLTVEDRQALDFLLQTQVKHVVSLLVDHDTDCICAKSAQRVMALAGWTQERLAELYVEEMFL